MSLFDPTDAVQLSPGQLASLTTPIIVIGSWLFWIYGPKKRTARQRLNHVKLVFQNILAGQELQTASLAIYESEDVAREKSDAVASLLAHSRKLGAALCKNSAQLSRHNTQEQLRVNNAYREIFTDAQKVFSQVYTQDFDSTFQPHDGWHSFEQSFVRDAIGTMKKNDPFWEVEK